MRESEKSQTDPIPIPEKKYEDVSWSETQNLFLHKQQSRNKIIAQYTITFTFALKVKLRRSILGTYLECFNYQQNQNRQINDNKLSITNWFISNFNKADWTKWNKNNDTFDKDFLKIMDEYTMNNDLIDWNLLYENVENIRLDNYYINVLDSDLKKFWRLSSLVLCGNWLTDIEGSFLPRTLKFLELYANEISSIRKLAIRAPRNLSYLGLGRNKLNSRSDLHLLAGSPSFKRLTILDLCDCDIYNLAALLERIKILRLHALFLEGNPCAVVQGYKDAVVDALPKLRFLDGVRIPDDIKLVEYSTSLDNAEIIFYVDKITNLPPPPKQKGVKQTIHMEICLPLLAELPQDGEIEDKHVVETPQKEEKKGKTKNPKSSAKGKKQKSSIYQQKSDFKIENYVFQTDPIVWKKVISFKPISIKSPDNNLIAIRDTFRSKIRTRLVYQKIQPPKKEKKGKGKKGSKKDSKTSGKKGKKGKKGSEKSSKDGKDKKGNEQNEKPVEEKKEPKEVLQERVILASFDCNLDSVKWNARSADYYWLLTDKFGPKALPGNYELEKKRQKELELKRKQEVEQRKLEEKKKQLEEKKKAKANKGKDKKGKGQKDKKSKSSKSTKSSKSKKSKSSKGSKKGKKGKKEKDLEKDALTFQIGFGLKRS